MDFSDEPTIVPHTAVDQATKSTAAELSRTIVELGLVDESSISSLTSSLSGEQLTDAQAFADSLVASGLITDYQAHSLVEGGEVPLVMGEYHIVDKVGSGGMGAVYRASQVRMNRTVAIKILPREFLNTPRAVKRFFREVKAAARLIHPNVVHAYDAGEFNGLHYLVMELIEGADLSSLAARRGPFPVALAVECICQAAEGLSYAHASGLVHRDVKPANLVLEGLEAPETKLHTDTKTPSATGDSATSGQKTESGSKLTLRILDLGLARINEVADDTEEDLTRTGMVMGTIDYMAPEQAEDAKTSDARSDIYSLGCTLFRLLAGQHLYPGNATVQKLMAHATQPIPSLQTFRSDVPEGLNSVFKTMVAKLPKDRQQDMSEVIEQLRPFRKPTDLSAKDWEIEFQKAANAWVGQTAATVHQPRHLMLWSLLIGAAVGLAAVFLLPKLTSHQSTPEVQSVASAIAEPQTTAADVLVIMYQGRAIEIADKEEILIGRVSTISEPNLVLDPNDRLGSRRHATITRDGNTLTIKDLDSTNGVDINGELKVSTPREIQAGDIIMLGQQELQVILKSDLPPDVEINVLSPEDHLAFPGTEPRVNL